MLYIQHFANLISFKNFHIDPWKKTYWELYRVLKNLILSVQHLIYFLKVITTRRSNALEVINRTLLSVFVSKIEYHRWAYDNFVLSTVHRNVPAKHYNGSVIHLLYNNPLISIPSSPSALSLLFVSTKLAVFALIFLTSGNVA